MSRRLRASGRAPSYNLGCLNTAVFLIAGVVLLVAQVVLVVHEVNAARTAGGETRRDGHTSDAAWAALPGLLILVLLAYTLFQNAG